MTLPGRSGPAASGSTILPLRPVPAGLRLAGRPPDAHKGTFGTVVVIGGSPGLSGAPHLAAMGAARAGAGLVRVCVPASVWAQVATRSAEVMVHALPAAAAGGIDVTAADTLAQHLSAASAVVLGPGASTQESTATAILAVLERLTCPAVVDADALTIVAAAGFEWRRCPQPVVITPHPGEMSRLLGAPVRDVQTNRSRVAAAYARCGGVTVVLKGHPSVVVAPDGRSHVDGGGGVVALATGGTGDVLAGVIGAMIAQGLDTFSAAVAGVTVHAEAGAAVERERGRAGGVASDVIDALPAAQERIRRELEGRGS